MYKAQISNENKLKAIAEIKTGKSLTQVAAKYKVSIQSVSRWVRIGITHGAQQADVNRRKAKCKKALKNKLSLREALYNQVAEEYQVTEAKLQTLHTKLKFLGEDWNVNE